MSEDPQKLPAPESTSAEAPPPQALTGETPPAPEALSVPEAPLPAPTLPSAGTLIRQAREASGLHIAALAVALKVPVKRLEALEADRFDLLPSAVFSRALASSVCRSLKMDPTQVLAQLPRLSAPRLSYSDENRMQSYAPPSSGHRPGLWSSLSRPSLIAGALLLVGAALMVFLPQLSRDGLQIGAGEGPVVTTTVTPLEAGAAAASDGVVAQSAQSALAAPAPTTPAPPALAAVAPVAATTKSTGPTAAGPVSALPIVQGPETAKGPSTGIVVFTPTAASWVEVTDAQGAVLLRRMLSTGEVAGATGALPLSVVVGRADVTRVQLRGQDFDLSPIARDNVARFEVK